MLGTLPVQGSGEERSSRREGRTVAGSVLCLQKQMLGVGSSTGSGRAETEEEKSPKCLENLAREVHAEWRGQRLGHSLLRGQQKAQLVPGSWLGREGKSLAARGQVAGFSLMQVEGDRSCLFIGTELEGVFEYSSGGMGMKE